jgi:hypothetical protein
MSWVTCADFFEPFIPGEWRPYRLARLSEVNPPRIPQSPHGTRHSEMQGVFTNTRANPFVLSIFRELRSNVCACDLSIIPSTQEAVT